MVVRRHPTIFVLIVYRFKLKLCPRGGSAEVRHAADQVVLPPGKDIVNIYADFMAYLLECTRKYFCDHFPRGTERWDDLFPRARFIIAHPNGWEGLPHSKLRRAAVLGGLIRGGNITMVDRSRIYFVPEGEASLHYCLHEGIVVEADQVRAHSRTCDL
jgi:hypothetical protein